MLFFIGLGLAIWFTFFTTGIGRSKGEFDIRFRRISQLKDGDPVNYNGIQVGKVAMIDPEIDKTGKPVVRVSFSIDKKFHKHVLVSPTTRWRVALGVLGGATLDILSADGTPIVREQLDTIMGEDAVGIPETVESAHALIEENRPDLHDLLLSARKALDRFGEMSEQVRDLIKDNRQQINSALAKATDMAAQIGDLVRDNRAMVAAALSHIDGMSKQIGEMVSENRDPLRTTMKRLPEATDNFINAAKRIADLIDENRENMHSAIAKLAEFAPHLLKVGENFAVISTQIAEGKGTVGKLVFEDTFHERATAAANSIEQRMEEIKPVTSSLTELKLYAGLEGGYDTDSGVGFGEAYLRIEPRPWKFYEGGVSYRTAPSDRKPLIEDPDKLHVDFNFLFGWRYFPDDEQQVYHLTVAGGLVESELGGGFELPIAGQHLRAVGIVRHKHNNRDLLDRRYENGSIYARAQLEYRPWLRYGIWAVAGVNDIIDHADPWVGIRLELLDNDLRNMTSVSSFAK